MLTAPDCAVTHGKACALLGPQCRRSTARIVHGPCRVWSGSRDARAAPSSVMKPRPPSPAHTFRRSIAAFGLRGRPLAGLRRPGNQRARSDSGSQVLPEEDARRFGDAVDGKRAALTQIDVVEIRSRIRTSRRATQDECDGAFPRLAPVRSQDRPRSPRAARDESSARKNIRASCCGLCCSDQLVAAAEHVGDRCAARRTD